MRSKIVVFIIAIGIIAGVGIGVTASHSDKQSHRQVLGAQAQMVADTPTQVMPSPTTAPGVPVTISIPKINVNATVETVGMDSQGRMDVPKNAVDTAWYSPGYRPGTNGSAVIDGHYDRVTGAPAVFWNLKNLNTGDTIIVTDNNGHKYTFSVDRLVKYPDNNFPIKEVFAASAVPMLNLITCNGIWDKVAKNYSDRLVVYSRLIAQN